MTDNRQELETLFVQTLSGHSFLCVRPTLESEAAYNTLVTVIKSEGIMVCGDVRVPWHSIAFIARGEAARSLAERQYDHMQAQNMLDLAPQGSA